MVQGIKPTGFNALIVDLTFTECPLLRDVRPRFHARYWFEVYFDS